jgi:hypothetical protein
MSAEDKRGKDMQDNKSFNERRVNLEHNATMLRKVSENTIRNMQLAKASAYRMAIDFIAIRQHHLADLRAEVEALWPKQKDGIDRWIAREFQPYVAIGGDPYELFRAIQSGVTLKQFLGNPFAMPLNRGLRAAVGGMKSIATEPPPPPPESWTLEQQLEMWKARAFALEQQVRSLRPLQGQVEKLRRKLKQLQAIVDKVPL